MVGRKNMIVAHTVGIRNVRVTIAVFVLIRLSIAADVVEMEAKDCNKNKRLNLASHSSDHVIVGLTKRLLITVCLLLVGSGHC